MAKEAHHHDSSVKSSSRYTPPAAKELYESPKWVPILMFVFLGLGVVSILLRYVVPAFENTNNALNDVLRGAPVAVNIDVSERENLRLISGDRSNPGRNLACHKCSRSQR